MDRHPYSARSWIAIAALLLAAVTPPAIGLHDDPMVPHIVVLGITEGPDPVGMVFWQPFVHTPESAARGRNDGRPDVFTDPVSGYPTAVWSHGIDDKYDIAYSRWDGNVWRDIEFLVEGPADELEPRIFFNESGDGYLVWWQQENGGTVYVSTMNAGGGWSEPRVVAEQAQRPSIINWVDRLMIVFERPHASGVDIVLHQNFGGAGYHEQVVAKVSSVEHPDPMIHRDGATIWIDWISAPGEYEWARMFAGRFVPVGKLPWLDRSWQGDQEARAMIRDEVLVGN